MKDIVKRVFVALEKDKQKYKYTFYNEKTAKLILVKERYIMNKKMYVQYADDECYGKDMLYSKLEKNYIGIGIL